MKGELVNTVIVSSLGQEFAEARGAGPSVGAKQNDMYLSLTVAVPRSLRPNSRMPRVNCSRVPLKPDRVDGRGCGWITQMEPPGAILERSLPAK